MLLVYSPHGSQRLNYICGFIFKTLGINFSISHREDELQQHQGPSINYSTDNTLPGVHIVPAGLLQQQGILPQQINQGNYFQLPIIYTCQEGDLPFDIFAAAFFLISRYEEYLPYAPDEYGRFPYKSSTAYKFNFLNRPLVNEWMFRFAEVLKSHYPALQITLSEFSFLPTYDIDMAWSYRNKGLLRNLGGLLKGSVANRLAVLTGKIGDPFDVYDWLDAFHRQYHLHPLYFFLLAGNRSRYDKNISPSNPAFQKLIKEHNKKYTLGIHPSWQSNRRPELLQQEIGSLASITGSQVIASRQHYIALAMPKTYRALINAGITDDYSMGYGSINGFRASVNHPFRWYDILKEEKTTLTIHPFCFMDANSYYEQGQSVEETKTELEHFLKVCKQSGGKMITIFHNSFLGTDHQFKGWKELYTSFIKQV